VRLVFLDRDVSLLGVPDVKCVDFTALHLDRCREFSPVIDVVVTVDLPIFTHKLLRIMVDGFSSCDWGIGQNSQAENSSESKEKTSRTIHFGFYLCPHDVRLANGDDVLFGTVTEKSGFACPALDPSPHRPDPRP
jgi:hypothetical protein